MAAKCPACNAENFDGRYCASCGHSGESDSSAITEAREAPQSASEQEPRFTAGDVLAHRYRIVERVGAGGMGEVYHAEDLSLRQRVALKFLPEAFTRDHARLERFRQEVRVARQIAHPNVCRVYDLGESDGVHFISMEFIRGEDLSSLLHRIGRLPHDKSVEIARQLAAGLAAAHERGILHRDLKPANIRIDTDGRAHLTDFGLAAAAGQIEDADIRSGTPAYMAPEQWEGTEVTEKSDLYSLGLVVYEMFTGVRPFEEDVGDVPLRQVRRNKPTPPSKLVEGLDPAVERIVMQCLELEPTARPVSASAIRGALPGADPLRAAIAEGRTPAPELVADAGREESIAPALAWASLLFVLLSLPLTLWLAGQSKLSSLVPLPRAPDVLVSDARAILRELGYPTASDWASGFGRDDSYIDHLMESPRERQWWDRLRRPNPSTVRFWYREGPSALVASSAYVSPEDPPMTSTGMVLVELDTTGNLRRLTATTPAYASADAIQETDWQTLLSTAGFEEDAFVPTEPRWYPDSFANARAAWTGNYPDAPELPIRVEAASFNGRPVSFRVIAPWEEPNREDEALGPWLRAGEPIASPIARYLHTSLRMVLFAALAFLARHNLQLGRGDRKTAFRLALFFFALQMLRWLFGAHHVAGAAWTEVFFSGLSAAFYSFGFAWLFYIAVEPYARRLWPHSMISWIRIFDGRFRDPVVGQHVLMGCVFGAAQSLVFALQRTVPGLLGFVPSRPDLPPLPAEMTALGGVGASLSYLFAAVHNNVMTIFYVLTGLLILRFLLRRDKLAAVAWSLLVVTVWSSSFPEPGFVVMTGYSVLWLLTFFRYGLLSVSVGLVLWDVVQAFPTKLDPGSGYFHSTAVVVLLFAALSLYGFRASLAGRPAFEDLLPELSERSA